MTKKSTAISDKELESTYSGPALLANKFYMTTLPFGIRLTFAEGHTKVDPVFRSAVFLSPADCRALRDLLSDNIARMDALNEQAKRQTLQ